MVVQGFIQVKDFIEDITLKETFCPLFRRVEALSRSINGRILNAKTNYTPPNYSKLIELSHLPSLDLNINLQMGIEI